MSVPQCVEPGNFNSTNNPLPYKNACILGGPIDINDPTLKAANQYCCESTGGIVRADSCYLVCQFNLLNPMGNWESCLADKFKTTPAPMGVKEQCFGTLFENPNTNDTSTLTFTPSSTNAPTATPTDNGPSATQTAPPSKTTISLSPTSSLTVSSVIIGGAPKPTASGNSSTPTSGSNSSSTASASPSSITPPSKASRGSISMGAVFVVGLAFMGLMI